MVYVLLANGFEELEALAPYDILVRGDVEVRFVSVNGTDFVTGTHGVTVRADMRLDEIRLPAEMTVLPGGMPGMTHLNAVPGLDALLDGSDWLAAICASPSVLGLHGKLNGKKATCFPGFEKNLKGAQVSEERVVRDGNVITAKGAGVACEFGFALLAALRGEEIAARVRASMQ